MRSRTGFGVRQPAATSLLVAGLVSLGVVAAFGEQIQKSFSTAPNPSFRLHSHSGTISVQGWDQNQVEIRAETASPLMEVAIDGGEDKVTVQAHPRREGISPEEAKVSFEIRVPKKAMVWLESEQGEITVENLEGTVSVEGGSNAVALSNINGHITVRTVDGPIVIRSSQGHIKADSITGELRFLQVDGAELSGTTDSGPITYQGNFGMGGTYILRNYSSPITIECSKTASFDVTARSVQGTVQNSLPIRPFPRGNQFGRLSPEKFLQGRINTGKSTVQVTSYSGTIRLY